MDRNEKREKKSLISQFIDLENGRYTDDKIEKLYKLVENREKYNGKEKTKRTLPHRGWSADGYFERSTETTHRFNVSDDGIQIIKEETIYDDDKTWPMERTVFSTAKDILSNMWEVFDVKEFYNLKK